MERIVAKFGGSSVADGAQITKVKANIEADPRRRIVVVSAPGRRQAGEAKLTDLLYLCHEMAAMSTAIDKPFALIRGRFAAIVGELALSDTVLGELDRFAMELQAGVTRDFVASRGEYFCAKLVAEYLGGEFIGPAEAIIIRANGTIDQESYPTLALKMHDKDRLYVMAGIPLAI